MFDLKQIQKMQAQMQDRMEKIQGDLEETEVSGTAGGNALTVTSDGNGRLKSVLIKPGIVELDDEDREMLQDLMIAAANQALDQARQIREEQMGAVTGGMKIPGLNM